MGAFTNTILRGLMPCGAEKRNLDALVPWAGLLLLRPWNGSFPLSRCDEVAFRRAIEDFSAQWREA